MNSGPEYNLLCESSVKFSNRMCVEPCHRLMEDRMEVLLSDPFGLSSGRQYKYHDLECSNK